MTTGCPSNVESCWPICLATMSTVPPARNGTMILIGRLGYDCAEAAPAVTKPIPIAAAAASSTRLLIILSSPFYRTANRDQGRRLTGDHQRQSNLSSTQAVVGALVRIAKANHRARP